jgi:hypothetical protein
MGRPSETYREGGRAPVRRLVARGAHAPGRGEEDRKALSALRPLAAKIDDSFCKSQWLAAEIAAVAEGLAAVEKAKPTG